MCRVWFKRSEDRARLVRSLQLLTKEFVHSLGSNIRRTEGSHTVDLWLDRGTLKRLGGYTGLEKAPLTGGAVKGRMTKHPGHSVGEDSSSGQQPSGWKGAQFQNPAGSRPKNCT